MWKPTANRPFVKCILGIGSLKPLASTVRTTADSSNRWGSRVFFAIIVLAPLPFGSHDFSTVSFWCLALCVALILCDPSKIGNARTAIITTAISVLLIFVFMAFIQSQSPPPLNITDPLWTKTAELLGGNIKPSVAIPRYAPLYRLGPTVACVLSFVLGVIIGSDRCLARQTLGIFAWSGAAYALYGIISAITEPGMILWREREGYIGDVLGPFPYRNTAATYFGSCTIVWFLALCEILKNRLHHHGVTWTDLYREILSDVRSDVIVNFVGFFVCFMALLMTGSRAGTTIFICAVIGAGNIYFRQYFLPKRVKFLIIGAAILAALLILQFLGGSVNYRFETLGVGDEGRPATYKAILKMLADHPLWGTGLGTFPWAFPQYRGSYPSITGIWELAHSTPLELAAEMGLPFSFLIGLGWALIIAILLRGVIIRQRDTRVPLSAAAIGAAGLLHTSVDFAFQITGYSIVAMAIIGAGIAQSFRSTSPIRAKV